MPKTAACFSVLLLACGTPPPTRTAVAAGPRPSAAAEPAPDPGEEPPRLAAADTYTCVLDEGELRCAGAIPSAGEEPIRSREVEADLLVATAAGYCVAQTGGSAVRCFGVAPPDGVFERWMELCEDDDECMERAEQEWADEGALLDVRGAVRDLDAYDVHTCALTDVELVCWDLSRETLDESLRVPISDAVEVAVELAMICVRTAAGGVLCGDLEGEELGPLLAVQELPPVEHIGLGGGLACGFTADGTAFCWGSALWIAEEMDLEERVASRVPMLDGTRALRPSAQGAEIVCALAAAGTIRCWGDNRYASLGPRAPGQLETTAVSAPVDDAVGIAVGLQHVCAVDRRRQIHCWGRADGGALGEARARRDYRPTEVPGVRAEALEVGPTRSCARTASGWMCWGRGYGDDRLDPWSVRPIDLPAGARPIELAGCTLDGTSLRCGDRTVSVRAVAPVPRCVVTERRTIACVDDGRLVDVEGASGVVAIAGYFELTALTEAGELVVFRRSSGAYAVRRRQHVGDDAVELVAPFNGPCVRRRDRSVWCSSTYGDRAPSRVELPPVDSLVGGQSHVCALARGEVYCWGMALEGQVGRAQSRAELPLRVEGVERAVEIAAGRAHTCARLEDGRVICWGADADGQLGVRPAWWTEEPVRMTELERRN